MSSETLEVTKDGSTNARGSDGSDAQSEFGQRRLKGGFSDEPSGGGQQNDGRSESKQRGGDGRKHIYHLDKNFGVE